uniref:Uncharacterized protein n=1 Tax=Avena sativa TaxID=4498 RepID=A0ACD5ZSJ2_AVESA
MTASQQQEAGVSGPLAVLLLLLLTGCPIVHAAGAGAEARLQHYMVVQTSYLEPKSICSGLKVIPSGKGAWVPLRRPYGPCSSPASAPPPSLVELLRWDQVRTDYVRRTTTGGDVLDPDTVSVHMSQVDYKLEGSFIIGTGGRRPRSTAEDDGGDDAMFLSQTMAIDTTVDVPWIQCLPCPFPQCYPQRDAFFDPKRSSTAAAVRCGSRACRALGAFANGCTKHSNNSAGECKYLIKYGDKWASAGTYMTDTLTLSPSITFLNFRFGCSHAVRGNFSSQTSGTMSLGGGTQSLIAQTAHTFGYAFSYCVPQSSATGFLSLGRPVDGASSFVTTPLLGNAAFINPSIYLVRLQGINVPPAIFSGGTVMDSSSIVTQLPPTAYRALRRAFTRAMTGYPRRRGRVENLDTCYDLGGFTNVTVPAVSLVFEGGAVVKLDTPAVLLEGCLAFTAVNTDFALGFMGNVQQQTQEVLFDVDAGVVGFRRGAC